MTKTIRTAVVMLTLIACGGDDGPNPIEQAAEECDMDPYVRDDGNSITMSTKGEEDNYGVSTAELVCVLTELDTPDHVLQRMTSTRALDGMQDAEWDDILASWTYHPDDGLTIALWIK